MSLTASDSAAIRSNVPDQKTYETLNGVRGAAAICVVVFHCHDSFWAIELSTSGYLAVDLFFVLSGFILAGAYGERLGMALSTRHFALLRLVRFYPLYLVGLILGTVAASVQVATGSAHAPTGNSVGPSVIYALLFLPAYFPGVILLTPLNGPAWSLLMEFWVNLAWARGRRSAGKVVLVAVILISGCVLVSAIGYDDLAAFETQWGTILPAVARTVFSFAVGLALFQVRDRFPQIPAAFSWIVLAATPAYLFVAPTAAMRSWYDLLVVLCLSPLLVAVGSRTEPIRGRRIFALLGAISYPLYALHQPLLTAFIFVARVAKFNGTVAGLLFLTVALVVAWVADKVDARLRPVLLRVLHERRAGREARRAEPAAP